MLSYTKKTCQDMASFRVKRFLVDAGFHDEL
jgi:hypothetical protein